MSLLTTTTIGLTDSEINALNKGIPTVVQLTAERSCHRKTLERLQQLESENARLRSMLEWRPMDEAPKDGTEILVQTEHGSFWIVRWSRYLDKRGDPHGPAWNDDYSSSIEAKCWMPLPPAPEAARD